MTDETKRDNGGPAFPCLDEKFDNYRDGTGHYRLNQICSGMSLRDYFAGQALAAGKTFFYSDICSPADVARVMYDIADAMIAERIAERKK